MAPNRAIDCLVNVDLGDRKQPEWMIRVKEDYFRAGDEFLQDISEEKLLADMDEAGVEKAILSIGAKDPDARSLAFAAQYLQRPVPPEGNLIKRDWLKSYDDAPPHDPGAQVTQSWDLASTTAPHGTVGQVG